MSAEIVRLHSRSRPASTASVSEGTPPPSPLVVPPSSFLVPRFMEDRDGGEREVNWTLRAWAEGRLDPLPVMAALPSVPAAASAAAGKVAAFAACVFGVRAYVGLPEDAPMACEWVGDWVEMSKPTAWRALADLVTEGVLVVAGEMPGRRRRGTRLYLPGGGAR